MGRKVDVCGDLFDEDVIAFVRKLRKVKNDKAYVMQLADGYKLDGSGFVTSIFLDEEQGLSILAQLRRFEEDRSSGSKTRSLGISRGKVGKGAGAAAPSSLGETRVPALCLEDDTRAVSGSV